MCVFLSASPFINDKCMLGFQRVDFAEISLKFSTFHGDPRQRSTECKKHRVQKPRHVTKPNAIASTHAQIRPRIIMCMGIHRGKVNCHSPYKVC